MSNINEFEDMEKCIEFDYDEQNKDESSNTTSPTIQNEDMNNVKKMIIDSIDFDDI